MRTITRARALTLALAGTSIGALAKPSRAQTNPTLNLGVLPVESAAAAYYARDLGYFAKAGLDVTIQAMANTPNIVAAVVGGALDIGYTTIDTIASIHSHGIPLVVIAPATDYIDPTTVKTAGILVRPDSPIRTAKDLEGKTIAVAALNDQTAVALRKWLTENGADYNKVHTIEMGYPEMIASLSAGRIDAAMLAEPFQTAARKGDARLFAKPFDSIAPEFNIGVWATTRAWADAHPDLVKKFAAAIYASARWANTHHAESAQILAKTAKADPKTMSGMIRAIQSTDLTLAHLQPPLDVAYQFHLLDKKIDAAQLIWNPNKP